MQFQVPQFIEVEDKIFGPLTAKQFFYILGAGALIFLLYVFFEMWLVVILGAPVAALAGSLAFLKINGIPFVRVLNSAIAYFLSNRLYVWRKTPLEASRRRGVEAATKLPLSGASTLLTGPKLTENKLQDLAWSLDIQHKPFNRKQ